VGRFLLPQEGLAAITAMDLNLWAVFHKVKLNLLFGHFFVAPFVLVALHGTGVDFVTDTFKLKMVNKVFVLEGPSFRFLFDLFLLLLL
tara:strand:+ start:258 stop:521 length:264 start_codon:yes stop_codon:yes gene_type:complete